MSTKRSEGQLCSAPSQWTGHLHPDPGKRVPGVLSADLTVVDLPDGLTVAAHRTRVREVVVRVDGDEVVRVGSHCDPRIL